jgi:hypothetical protein
MINNSDLPILSANDIDASLLIDFYKVAFPLQTDSWKKNWKWRYRLSFNSAIFPMVIVHNNHVIAHLGVIPFKLSINEKTYTATYGGNHAVLPDFQRHGIGKHLVKKWMEMSDIYIGFPNERSIGIYKKFGWIESFNTYLHFFPLNPFDHQKFVSLIPNSLRRSLNIIVRPLFFANYHFNINTTPNINFLPLNSNSIEIFVSSLNRQNNLITPLRDSDFLNWRLLDSPDKEDYYIITERNINDVVMIIKLFRKNELKYIDILMISNRQKLNSIRYMISALAIWGIKNNYSYIRYFTSQKHLSDYLRKSMRSIVRHPRFISYSNNKSLYDRLLHCGWDLEIIDCEFEEF